VIKGSIRSAAAWILLLAVAVLAARKAYGLYGAYNEFWAVEKQLPDLPQVIPPIAQARPGFPDKIWVHRVNSVERARLMAKEYRGLEMDVVYDSAADYYDVGHPPTPSLGISLDQVFSSLPDVGSHYFWLDFKNLSDANKEAACARLVSLARKYRIGSHVIVESGNPEALACFGARGFYTAYNLFPDDNLAEMTPAQIRSYYEEVRANLLAYRVNALSSNYRSLPFIEKYFTGIDILTWYRDDARNLRHYATLGYLAQKRRVKVILVKHWSAGYR
jgi:hypothetical protein